MSLTSRMNAFQFTERAILSSAKPGLTPPLLLVRGGGAPPAADDEAADPVDVDRLAQHAGHPLAAGGDVAGLVVDGGDQLLAGGLDEGRGAADVGPA